MLASVDVLVIIMEFDIETLGTYPMESDDWLITVAIGGIASFLSVFIIPIFVVGGYLVRALRAGMEGADEPPVFDEWGELIREGVIATVITFIYQLIPSIVFAVFVGGSALAFLTGSEAGTGLGLFGLLGGFFLWWVLAIVFGYVGFAGVANYAREGSIGAGFDFDVIINVVTSRDYLLAWLYVIALNIVVGVVTSVLNIIPGLGALVGVFLSFYALIIAGWLWGGGFASATEMQPGTEVSDDTAAV